MQHVFQFPSTYCAHRCWHIQNDQRRGSKKAWHQTTALLSDFFTPVWILDPIKDEQRSRVIRHPSDTHRWTLGRIPGVDRLASDLGFWVTKISLVSQKHGGGLLCQLCLLGHHLTAAITAATPLKLACVQEADCPTYSRSLYFVTFRSSRKARNKWCSKDRLLANLSLRKVPSSP